MAYTDIDDGSEYFQTAAYSGNGTTLAVTSQGNATIAPDFVWVKRRNSASSHALLNSNLGRSKSLSTHVDEAEYTTTVANKDLISFDTDGFTVGPAEQRNMNGANQTFVGWQWKCNGGTKGDNDDGSITVNLQVNQQAGFSIGTYTGTGDEETLGHGLGVAPKVHITKKTNGADAWNMYHESIGNTHGLRLNNNGIKEDFGFYGDTSPTSSVFTIGGVTSNDRLNTDGASYVFYSFAEKQGYSKFGSYIGNSNANGTFVYTGFKPAWVMTKGTFTMGDSNNYNWYTIVDDTRSPINTISLNDALFANDDNAEGNRYSGTGSGIAHMDFLSNGFKLRGSSYESNQAGEYVFLAFAENPFVSSKGTPVTAR